MPVSLDEVRSERRRARARDARGLIAAARHAAEVAAACPDLAADFYAIAARLAAAATPTPPER